MDPNSTAAGTPDGTDDNPYLTIQTAFDASFSAGEDYEMTFAVVPCNIAGNTAGPLSIPANGGLDTSISIIGNSGSVRSIETPVQSTGIGAAALVDSVTVADASQNTSINFDNIELSGPLTAHVGIGTNVRFSFTGCQVGGISAQRAYVLLDNTSLEGDLTADVVEAYSSTAVAPSPGVTWTANTLKLDSATSYQLRANSVTLTGQIEVMDRPARATVSVTVPALAAGVLGYATASMVGTELDGIDVGDPVVVNPLSQLASAGANGGFMGVPRVSALNTVEIPFKGALAGGATNFLFARG